MNVHGVVNVLKPPGMTSHDVVSVARRVFGIRQVGHSGTLDPAAAGVLPIFVGSATRLIEYFPDDKEYIAEVLFGYETDTDDYTGIITASTAATTLTEAQIVAALPAFCGAIDQIPPRHAAIKVDGKKLYEYARSGQEVEVAPRRVTISAIDLLSIAEDAAIVQVSCSSGTYIRSLCRDIGRALSTRATMGLLLRSRVGVFNISDAVCLEELSISHLHECAAMLQHCYPVMAIDDVQAKKFENGLKFTVPHSDCSITLVYNNHSSFLGVAAIQESCLIAKKVFKSN